MRRAGEARDPAVRAEVGAGREHDTERADLETASEGYAARFEGPVGHWMLDVQARGVLELLRRVGGERSVLELGGGHEQLCGVLRDAGHRVVVHGSTPHCHARRRRSEGRLPRVASYLWRLPFPDRGFDVVVAVRLLAHVERWRELLAEMTRVSAGWLLVDFPLRGSIHRLAPALFGAKRRIEGNTRPYFDYAPGEVEGCLEGLGFRPVGRVGQFVLPMALHRAVGRPGLSKLLEGGAARAGLRARLGSPLLLLAERSGGPRPASATGGGA